MKIPGFELSLGIEIVPRPCRVDETTASPSWRADFHNQLVEATNEHDGWGWIVQRPNCDLFLYDIHNAEHASYGGCRAWVIVGREEQS